MIKKTQYEQIEIMSQPILDNSIVSNLVNAWLIVINEYRKLK